MKLKVLLVFGLSFFAFQANAEVIINEVKLSPTGDRFIELYNSGSSAVNLTDWYLQRKTANGSSFGSLVSKTVLAGKSIPANDYFVISKTAITNSDLVVEDLTLTESNTIQIKNADGDVVSKLGWGSSNDCSNPCPANPGDGESLFRNNAGSWVVGASTAGTANEVGVTTTVANAPASAPVKVVEQKMRLDVKSKPLAFPGVPLKFEVTAYGVYGEPLIYGKYFWNFGDGDFRESDVSYMSEKFTHTFMYPGEYTVLLEYYKNYFSGNPDMTKEIIIRVLASDLAISEVGTSNDFFVEISNLTGEDADISNWYLTAGNKTYMFPKNMVIKKDKKLRVSPLLTKLVDGDRYGLVLRNSQWGVVFDYGKTVYPQKVEAIKTNKVSAVTKAVAVAEPESEEITVETDAPFVAAPIRSKEEQTSYLPIGIFAGFLGISSAALYVLRRNKQEIEDFALLDE